MAAPETLPVIVRHLLRYNHQSKTPFQTTAKSLYHQTTAQAKGYGRGGAPMAVGSETSISISARIAASKGDRERILKSIERARAMRGVSGGVQGGKEAVGEGRVWEEQVYPPVSGWLV